MNIQIYEILSSQLMRTCFLEYREITYPYKGAHYCRISYIGYRAFLKGAHDGWVRLTLSLLKKRNEYSNI